MSDRELYKALLMEVIRLPYYLVVSIVLAFVFLALVIKTR
jgi:hypothetical protein